jgi:hypothetical protein
LFIELCAGGRARAENFSNHLPSQVSFEYKKSFHRKQSHVCRKTWLKNNHLLLSRKKLYCEFREKFFMFNFPRIEKSSIDKKLSAGVL